MTRALMGSTLLLLAACAGAKKERSGEVQGAAASAAAAAAKMAADSARAIEEARRECSVLEARAPGPAEEKWLGEAVSAELRKQGGAAVTDDVSAYVQTIGDKVGKLSARPESKWTVEVLENPMPGSRSAPGGHVFVTTGLLALVVNEAQLAAVLAHEVAHGTQHALKGWGKAKVSLCQTGLSARKMSAAMSQDAGTLPQGVSMSMSMGSAGSTVAEQMLKPDAPEGPGWWAASGMDAALVTTLVQTHVARLLPGSPKEDELEADDLAAKMLAAAGYDVRELLKIVGRLPAEGTGFARHADGADRLDGLARLPPPPKGKPGKAPPLPKKLKWPKPA